MGKLVKDDYLICFMIEYNIHNIMYMCMHKHLCTYCKYFCSTSPILPISPIFSALLPVPIDATDEQPIMMRFDVVSHTNACNIYNTPDSDTSKLIMSGIKYVL